MSPFLNDVHSRLNPTRVFRIERPESAAAVGDVILRAKVAGLKISVAGGRHAMGGQQFGTGSVHFDMTGLSAVISSDSEKGLLHIGAGAMWPAIIAATHAMPPGPSGPWGIRQKQTGVDDVSLGGSISANAHGRGLMMRPMADDIENLTLVTASGETVLCDRNRNAELFSLVVGGYGLFGVVVSATLRLAPRIRLKRLVDILDLDDAPGAVYRRVADGCVYGDFQFVIDASDERFLRRGVFSCYRPSDDGDTAGAASDLDPESWLKLLRLAHDDKREAFRLYSRHYLETDGKHYWSDTMQLATYVPSYADHVAAGGESGESLVIGEHYVPRDRLLEFMDRARAILRETGTEVIYGTIRAILKDDVSFLPWAREDFACVIFNLRTSHTEAGIAKTRKTFRALTDASAELGGSFYLTYHRYATTAQVERAYPRFREWLSLKKHYDTEELFTSDWYVHYRDAFADGEAVFQ